MDKSVNGMSEITLQEVEMSRLSDIIKHQGEWTEIEKGVFGYKGLIFVYGSILIMGDMPLVIGSYDESEGLEGMKSWLVKAGGWKHRISF